MTDPDDLYTLDNPEYAAFVATTAKDCRCCSECGMDRPCAATLAGGVCDQACRCNEDGPGYEEDYDDE
jgi:hypothetical protein